MKLKASAGIALPLILLIATPVLFAATSDSGQPGDQPAVPSHPDIPPRAAEAYWYAASKAATRNAGCQVSWALLAGIGKVESNHGRFGGSALGDDGVVAPPIVGIPLNGANGTAPIPDTDGGALDGDTVWDRAVGPMQFIPGTWAAHGTDADGERGPQPQDLDDAALTAALYLCAANPGDWTQRNVMVAGLFDYNRSTAYGQRVMALMDTYLREATTVATSGTGGILCPVAGAVSFTDTWGAPRSGGRRHEGQDLFADLGTPLVALADGTVTDIRRGAGLGGNILWLVTGDGHGWYYAHLQSFAAGLSPGQPVTAGEIVGYVGKTGNAATTPPHLHIQWRPDGRHGPDTNPYPLLDPACPGH